MKSNNDINDISVTKIAVVMAAGKGTRMKSDLPKALYPVCGRPMIEYVLDVLESVVQKIFVVVGYRGELIREALSGRAKLQFVEQTEQLGTGHAVMVCREYIDKYNGGLLVLAGDCPMVRIETINKLFDAYYSTQNITDNKPPACILGTAKKDNPTGLGRIVRDANGEFEDIVEERDATPEQRQIKEVNMSYYVFHTPDLLEALKELKSNNAQNEYYITDTPKILKQKRKKIIALPILKPIETLGINTVEEAKIVENTIQNKTTFVPFTES
ncbi:MAG: NTP transferase domain-containing protein [Planctomycetaceae bacterium]|jgi:bifunctional UDP-N-acetylglucosamine pyrophosphorylase/glucosamine-1-phosphate N-acetyltransferase/UDP-N-acetylglucosamine pyrophosphorylase|nr:NTP transferase domain-containing protein [Planctomycetaceae bacterium]